MNNEDLLVSLKNRFTESDVQLLSSLIFENSHPVGSYLITNNKNNPNTYLVGGGGFDMAENR